MKIKSDLSVCNAIEREWHKTTNVRLRNQTWEDFYDSIQDKKLVLFGMGVGIEAFLNLCENSLEIEAVLDNDLSKQGIELSRFFDKIFAGSDKKVTSPSYLLELEADSYVVLITSLRYFEQIAEQLESLCVKNYFAFLPMEEKRLKGYSISKDMQMPLYAEYENLPICEDKIVFYTMGTYSGHGKAIVEQLLRTRKELDIVWIVKNMDNDVPDGIRCVYIKNRMSYLKEMLTAKMWIYDEVMPRFVKKREGQIYIQTKHWSSVTLKTFGLQLAKFREDETYVKNCIHDGQMIDYFFSGSDFDTRTFRAGFNYGGKVVYIGSPRSDVLFENERIHQKIIEKYHIENAKKIVLYAPTFRISKTDGKQVLPEETIEYGMVLERMKKTFGEDWVLFVRFHPNLSWQKKEIENDKSIIDVTNYRDGQELVAISDVVITDYSSIMFEPAFVKKPVFLFAPDRNEYINGERELLIPYDTLPFPIAETNEQLAENIENFNQEEYEAAVTQFLDAYGVHEDGHASERAADFILDLLEKK